MAKVCAMAGNCWFESSNSISITLMVVMMLTFRALSASVANSIRLYVSRLIEDTIVH